jgi:hypothetical protein
MHVHVEVHTAMYLHSTLAEGTTVFILLESDYGRLVYLVLSTSSKSLPFSSLAINGLSAMMHTSP